MASNTSKSSTLFDATLISSAGYICRGTRHAVNPACLEDHVRKIKGNILTFHIYPEENYTHPNTAKAGVAVNGSGTVGGFVPVDGFAHDRVHHVTDKSGPPQPKRSKNGQGEDEGEFKVWTINIFNTDGLQRGLSYGNSGECQRVLTAVYGTIAKYQPKLVLFFFHDLDNHISPLSITLMFACDTLKTWYNINDPLFHPLPPIPADNGDRLTQDTIIFMSNRNFRRLTLYRDNLLRNKNGFEHRLASKEDKYECFIKTPVFKIKQYKFIKADPVLFSKGWEPAL